MRLEKKGFTLLEVMIAVMIVGMLLSLSYPSYRKSRENARRTICINNLRILQHAADRYVFDKPELTVLTPQDLSDYVKTRPYCPEGGSYAIEINGDPRVSCDHGSGHLLY